MSSAFYSTIPARSFAITVLLLSASISLWFVSAASVRISQVPPDAFYYLHQLPLSYWIGLLTTLALFGARGLVSNRARMLLELSTLFLFSLYLFAIPSVSYQDPRILDSYQHEGNALALTGARGWFNGPIWYVFQFPGAYTFFAQLTAIPGIDSFQLMKLYPTGLALVLSLLVYALAKSFSPNYAAVATAFIMSGLWFQLHLSPQSLELIMYVGVIFLLLKIVEDDPRRELWEMIALVATPILVLSHPETPLVLLLGIAGFFVVKPLFTGPRMSSIKSTLSLAGPFFLMLAIVTLAWWSGIASQALAEVQSIINGALTSGIPGLSHGAPNIPPTPAPDYHLTTLLQEGISASVWLLGMAVLLFVRRFNLWEFLLSGLFLAAISTIPIALFANADVLQRSYLFALFPAGLLFASLLERKNVLRIRRTDLVRPLSLIMLMMIVVFAFLMPMTRYAGDSFDSLPQSSLYTSNVTASLSSHSILFPHPGWYGWRYYSPSYGYDGGLLLEQSDISTRSGGFVKVNTYTEFNLTFTTADGTANYLLVSDYFNNLYTLRFGPNATYYISSHATFETQASMKFNLVYSTGTDRLYENSQWLG
jgi:hypothetical protein